MTFPSITIFLHALSPLRHRANHLGDKKTLLYPQVALSCTRTSFRLNILRLDMSTPISPEFQPIFPAGGNPFLRRLGGWHIKQHQYLRIEEPDASRIGMKIYCDRDSFHGMEAMANPECVYRMAVPSVLRAQVSVREPPG